MNAYSLPTCPKCKQTDQIQKVSSIYGINTKEWLEDKSSTDFDGHTHHYQERHEEHTQLGLKLQPPKQPSLPTNPSLWYGIGIFVGLVILLSFLCPIAFLPLGFLIPLFTIAGTVPDFISGVSNWVLLTAVVGGGTLIIVVIGVVLIVWLFRLIKRRYDRDMSNYRSKKAVYDNDELPRWQRANERWNQLFYCMRDDTVFIPVENKAIRAVDLENYLYNPLFTSQSY